MSMKLLEFGGDLQELVRFELEALVCTWMIDQIMKRNLEFQIGEFSWFASQIWFEIIWIFTLA
jgi:hypothetical protein